MTTLAFVSPQEVLPKIVQHLTSDIDLDAIHSLTSTDFGIWATPEDQTYIDGRCNVYDTTKMMLNWDCGSLSTQENDRAGEKGEGL